MTISLEHDWSMEKHKSSAVHMHQDLYLDLDGDNFYDTNIQDFLL